MIKYSFNLSEETVSLNTPENHNEESKADQRLKPPGPVFRKLKSGSSTGRLMILCGLLTLAPLLTLPFYQASFEAILSFVIPGLGSVLAGLGVCQQSHDKAAQATRHQQVKQGQFFVLFAWIYGIFIGALPFVLSGQLTWTQSLFESVSGWTTTGLSVMDVSLTTPLFLFHRGFMQYCGGLGFVMVMTLFIQNKQSMNLFQAEGHADQLMPNLARTVRVIVLMYTAFLILGISAYMLAGMNLFDSLIHAMCALSTGGFSNRAESIGYYNSPLIELITIVLMLIGTTNFAALLLLMRRRIGSFLAVSEIRFLTLLLLGVVPLTAFVLFSGAYAGLPESFRIAFFEAVSALSTSGFSTVSYVHWPQAAVLILIVMMIIGGGLGSTAGGLKLTRVYLMLRSLNDYLRRKSAPERTLSVSFYTRPQGRTVIDPKLIADTSCFFFCYLLIYLIGTFLLMLTADCTLIEAMFDFASSLGTVGLSIGITGPATPAPALIVEMIGMLMGRLEIFIVLIGIRTLVAQLKEKFS